MHFKVAKKQLLDGLNIVSRAVSLNSPLPSLHGILLVVKEDFIQMTASDLDISIQVKIVKNEDSHLEVAETGEIILDSKYILDMIRKIDSDEVEVEIIDGLLTKISGTSVNFEIWGSSFNCSISFFSMAETFSVMVPSSVMLALTRWT